ncbi:hypothetical protein [Pseudoduganella violaceinigra]|uniref:hypothetical protein n=1 Tax=Pseudoduganella violaceinigra TaxID=246602 RepID=UPI0004231B4A|nr:hypothetical protein [Pseudoduganella violaceinigra]
MKYLAHRLLALLLLVLQVQLANAADDVVVIGASRYQELGRYVDVKTGEIVVRLKPIPGPPPEQAVEKPVASNMAAPVAHSAEPTTGGSAPAEQLPKIREELRDALAREANANITDSPGLSVLGVGAGEINRAMTPKDVAVSLAKGTDATGKVKEGVALQFSPANVFFPSTLIGGTTYEDSWWMGPWARTSIELATSSSDDKRLGQQAAASLTIGLIDKADPRLAWKMPDDCARKSMAEIGVPPKPVQLMSEAEKAAWQEWESAGVRKAQACYRQRASEVSNLLWKLPRWYVGYAKSWKTGEGDKLNDLSGGPRMVWMTYSQGFDFLNPHNASATGRTLFELAANRKWQLPVQDEKDDSKLLREDRADVIARLRYSRDRWNAFIDYGLARVRTDGLLSANVRRFGYGAEYKVREDLWVVLGSVQERGFVNGDKRNLLNFGLKFGQTDKQSLEAVGPSKD